jgi:ribosome-associated toxin RatA of RatAB toxin-antitoxin module
MRFSKSLFAIASLLSVSTAFAAADIDVNRLSETGVEINDVSQSGVAGKSFIAGTIIDAPVGKLCPIIQNYADYPSFMPNTDKTVIVQATDAATVVDMTLKLPLGKIKKYRLRMEAKNGAQACHLAWKMVPRPELTQEETIADTSGYWELAPLASNKNKTSVKYFVYSDPGPVPMGLGWIVDSLGKDSLPKTLEALRSKARTH